MVKNLIRLLIGSVVASFSIACVINSTLGSFSVSAMNISVANLTGLSMGTVGFILEVAMLLTAMKLGEGIGVTAIVNATLNSYLVDFFHMILPTSPYLILGLPLVAVGWKLMGESAMGDTGSNILTTALMKKTRKSLGMLRAIQETVYFSIGLISASQYITPLTIILTLGLGYMLEFIYKLIKYNPIEVEHQFLIGGKEKIVENN